MIVANLLKGTELGSQSQDFNLVLHYAAVYRIPPVGHLFSHSVVSKSL